MSGMGSQGGLQAADPWHNISQGSRTFTVKNHVQPTCLALRVRWHGACKLLLCSADATHALGMPGCKLRI